MTTRQTDFLGTIRETFAESQPWWPEPAPSRRPNVVVVVLDDTGWSDLGCFGSEIATPTIDALATNGAVFNQFHVTPLCSPTRAALLSGRNHHEIGMRFLADTDTGFPNSRGAIRPDVKLLPQILRENGYGTYLLGKWHLAPLHEITPAGPHHNWPLARGFDHYYGFLDGCTDQYEPELYEDNHAVPVPNGDDYHLTEDLADHAIQYLRDHVTYRSADPFYLQFATGATHAPFQAPRQFIERYVSEFTKGWDQTRVDRLNRQIETGLVPAGTELTERADGVRAWDALSDDEREVFAHLQAAFAGFLEHTDAQLARVFEEIAALGEHENTIVLLLSDNGASREGGPTGDVDSNAPYSGVRRTAAEQMSLVDAIGTLTGGAHYPEGWAMAGNTPFRQYKQFVDLGGVRSPLVISWPGHVAGPTQVRDQFVHAIDIAPTILELLGIEPETEMDGASIAPALDDHAAAVGRETQSWEMLGHRAVWHKGWKAVTQHNVGDDYADDTWRLYDTHSDFSERDDLAQAEPARLAEMQQQWWRAAHEQDMFPLDDRPLHLAIAARGPAGLYAQQRIVLRPGRSHVPLASAVTGSNRSLVATAHLDADPSSASGVLLSSGNAQGGYVLYLMRGELVFEHSMLGESIRIASHGALSATTRTVGFAIRTGDAAEAEFSLLTEGEFGDPVHVAQTSAHLSFWGLDVGRVPNTTFTTAFEPPFALPDGILNRIEFAISPEANDTTEYAEVLLASE